jgi:hypothetical protein
MSAAQTLCIARPCAAYYQSCSVSATLRGLDLLLLTAALAWLLSWLAAAFMLLYVAPVVCHLPSCRSFRLLVPAWCQNPHTPGHTWLTAVCHLTLPQGGPGCCMAQVTLPTTSDTHSPLLLGSQPQSHLTKSGWLLRVAVRCSDCCLAHVQLPTTSSTQTLLLPSPQPQSHTRPTGPA